MEVLPEQPHKNSFFALLENRKRCGGGNLASHLTTGHILQGTEENQFNPFVCPDKKCQCRKIIFEPYIGAYNDKRICKLFSIKDFVRQTNAEIQSIDTAIYDFQYEKLVKMLDILVRHIELKRDQLKERIESKDISLYLSPQCYEVYEQFRSGENGFQNFYSKNEYFENYWRVSMDKSKLSKTLGDFMMFKSEIVQRLSYPEFRKKDENERFKQYEFQIFDQKSKTMSQSFRQKEFQIERDQFFLKMCTLKNINPKIAYDVQLQPERIQALSLQSNDLHLLQGTEFSNLRKLSLSISPGSEENLSSGQDLFRNLKSLSLTIWNNFDSGKLSAKFQEIHERGGLRAIKTVYVDCTNFVFSWLQYVRSLTALSIATTNLNVASLDSAFVNLELQVFVLEIRNEPCRSQDPDSEEEGYYYYTRQPKAKKKNKLPKPFLTFSNLKHLRVFHLSTGLFCSSKHDFQEGEFEGLCLSFPSLVELDLSHYAMSEKMCILVSKHFGCLERLKMVGCGLANKHLCSISNGIYRLKVLNVSNDTDGDDYRYSRRKKSWNSIDDRGFYMIIEGQPHLEALGVSNQQSSRPSSFLKLYKHLPKLRHFSIMFEYYKNFNFVYGLSKIKSVNINLEHSQFLDFGYRNQEKARKLEQLTCHHKSIFKLVNNSGCPTSLLSRINSFGEIKDRANRNLVLLMRLKQRQQQTDFFYKVEGQDGD